MGGTTLSRSAPFRNARRYLNSGQVAGKAARPRGAQQTLIVILLQVLLLLMLLLPLWLLI